MQDGLVSVCFLESPALFHGFEGRDSPRPVKILQVSSSPSMSLALQERTGTKPLQRVSPESFLRQLGTRIGMWVVSALGRAEVGLEKFVERGQKEQGGSSCLPGETEATALP